MSNYQLVPCASDRELAQVAARAWVNEVEAANHSDQSYCVALSGGRIAEKFFAAVVQQAQARAISFHKVHFFWADERCVPPGEPESNFRIAQELLLAPLGIGAGNIHRIRGEESPETAAQLAAAELLCHAPNRENHQPVLDLIFLGLGEDGHVASLFPGETDDLTAPQTVYRAIRHAPKPPPSRVTLGYSAIAAARQVWMLAVGEGKQTAMEQSLFPPGQTPFGRVLQSSKQVNIYTDIVVK